MRLGSQAARAARRLARILPDQALRRGARLAARGRSVSAVVVVTDQNAAFVEECVASLESQGLRGLEVLLVHDAVPGEAREAATRAAAARWRVHSAGVTPSDFRTGPGRLARQTSAEFLVVLDAGDLVGPGALASLVATAVDEAADVVGAARSDLGAARLADLVVRGEVWKRSSPIVPEWPEGDWVTAATLLLAAERPVRGPVALRSGQRRGAGVAFGTMPVRSVWAPAWWSAVSRILDLLEGDVVDGFRRWLLDQEVSAYLLDAERCTPTQWRSLVAVARRLRDEAPPATEVETRVRLWLAAEDRQADLSRYNAERWLENGQYDCRIRGSRAHAVLLVPEDLPDSVLELGVAETPVVAELHRLRWLDERRLEVQLVVFARRLGPGACTVELVGPAGRTRPLSQEAFSEPQLNLVAPDPFADHAGGGLRLVLDASRLLDTADGSRWRFEVSVDVGGVRVAGHLTGALLRGSAGALAPPRGEHRTLVPRRVGDEWGLEVGPGPASGAPDVVEDLRLDGADLVVRWRPAPGSTEVDRLQLHGPGGSATAEPSPEGASDEVRLHLCHDPWGLGSRALPAGTYRLRGLAEDGSARPLSMATALVSTLPRHQLTETFRMQVLRDADGSALVRLSPPLADDEAGPYAQTMLRRGYAAAAAPLDPSAVYLQAYTGEVATDSPRAIAEALRRTRPDLTLHWVVADRAADVPAGTRPVLWHSREWYAALATSTYLVTNVDMDRWFVKRPGQRLLQTYHGYPSKTMGVSAWVAKNFTPLRIERQLRRTSGTWDLLLTPTPAMDRYYRDEYRYGGPILAEGYPRDDALLAPDAGRVRAETRARLGIEPGRCAVLYAPTWRDDLATNFRSARLDANFDAPAVARALGEDYVVLVRGHRFHRLAHQPDAGVVDVSGYPEVNHLLLACDVAVLDYSSMRFDLALVRRPQVFLVPDLARYDDGVRGFLYDFAGSAPGPLLQTTEQVVDVLRDPARLERDYAATMDRFNARFNDRQDGHAADRVVRAFFGGAPDGAV